MQPEEIAVPVEGGTMAALRWQGEGPLVLGVHGITANAVSWQLVAEQLGGAVTLVAPDLRGRGRSASLPGPYGMVRHAADLVSLLDALDAPDAVVAGHSMGAYVGCVLAVREPARVRELVLIDGGVSFPLPQGTDIDAILHAFLGPAMQRLSMTFPSEKAYADYWRQHPALARDWSPLMDAYFARDLVGSPPQLRSSCVYDAARSDGAEVLQDPDTLAAVRKLSQPAVLLWAPRGLMDQEPGLYDDDRLRFLGLPASLRTRRVEDVNHYTVLLAERGAKVVAEEVRRAAGV